MATVLKAPQYSPDATYYESPLPSEKLVAPVETKWNPDDDPKFYYQVPALLTQQDLPTRSYPKKFNKDVHVKSKPFSSRPKQEIILRPIDAKEYTNRQNTLSKVLDKLAKEDNQKNINKVAKLIKKPKMVPSKITAAAVKEPQPAESGFGHSFNSEGDSFHGGDGDVGLSADITASLGITSPHSSSSSSERVNFHMVGHDGPHSYKWGYDTGKG